MVILKQLGKGAYGSVQLVTTKELPSLVHQGYPNRQTVTIQKLGLINIFQDTFGA